jgi:hypothetical protein
MPSIIISLLFQNQIERRGMIGREEGSEKGRDISNGSDRIIEHIDSSC